METAQPERRWRRVEPAGWYETWAMLAFATGFVASTWTDAGCAEPLPRIGFLGMDSAMQARRVAEFRDGLAALGYVDGKNIGIEYRWAEVARVLASQGVAPGDMMRDAKGDIEVHSLCVGQRRRHRPRLAISEGRRSSRRSPSSRRFADPSYSI